jgi:GDP-L-fucose synthase
MEISISDLAKLISQMIGTTGEIVWDASKPDGQPRRVLVTTRANRLFGFTATTLIEVGPQKTIELYVASLAHLGDKK